MSEQTTKTIKLDQPIKRGEQEITEITLRKPGAGALRVGGQHRAGAGESAGAESVCVCAGESAAVCGSDGACAMQ